MSADRPRVLFVDDEQHVLDGLRRQLHRDFSVTTAVGAANGLLTLGTEGPFAVVVSDFMMPGIDGATFLAAARTAAPDTTRMMLTGHANLEGAAATVNNGGVFRLLLKPAAPDALTIALQQCVEQHQLVVAERDLLEQTLTGSVRALTDVLALADPTAFARATRTRRLVSATLDHLGTTQRWAIELAAMLVHLGAVSLPAAVSHKLDTGEHLDPAEQTMIDAVPEIAEQLLAGIPRMAAVCEAIRYSHKLFDGTGAPVDHVRGEALPLGSRVMRLVLDYDHLTAGGADAQEALATLRSRTGAYDPVVLQALAVAVESGDAQVVAVPIAALRVGMVLAADVRSESRVLLVPRGQEVTSNVLARLHNFATMEDGVAEPILVSGARAETGSLALAG
jgi:response regulator RpfG family c-di-GMP phosphodiesterase